MKEVEFKLWKEYLKKEGQDYSVSEISRRYGVPYSEVTRWIQKLEEEGNIVLNKVGSTTWIIWQEKK